MASKYVSQDTIFFDAEGFGGSFAPPKEDRKWPDVSKQWS